MNFTVEKEQTAAHIGSGSVAVLSTPSMILFMEKASAILAAEHLHAPYTTVGTVVNIQHNLAVLQGERVETRSKLVEQVDRKLKFEVSVNYNGKVVGKGIHERYIVNEEKFLEKLRK